MTPRIGVCSWSLQAETPAELVARVRSCGVDALQLHLDPLRTPRFPTSKLLPLLKDAGIEILSGMMTTKGEDYSTLESIRVTGGLRPDEHWEENLRAARENALVARELGLSLVTLHVGFLPEDEADPLRGKMVDRIRQIVEAFAQQGVRLGLETGQERAETLQALLVEIDRKELGVNFDPANMILYGMGDPVDALRQLAPRVFQVHVKDALPTTRMGTWGSEVRVGTGAVDWPAFFDVLWAEQLDVDLVIEREAGEDRVGDVRAAHDFVRRTLRRDATPDPGEGERP
jgi:L-ribulose-5-phosphate 3-epimerase